MTDPQQKSELRITVEGTMFGLLAATAYSVANTGLRYAADAGDFAWTFWSVFTKALPACLATWAVVLFRKFQGTTPLFPSRRVMLQLIGAAALMQFGGNLMFQYSLSVGGLVLTVPLTFAFILTTGAVLSIAFLNESPGRRMTIAMIVLLVAIAALSLGGEGRQGLAELSAYAVLATVVASALSGISFGINSVVLRSALRDGAPISGVLVVFTTFGVTSMGLLSLIFIGPEQIAARSADRIGIMLGAGCANAAAFFAVGATFQRVSANRGNLLNATQIAMCALAGVVLFDEAFTTWVALGTGLTIAALVVVGTKPDDPQAQ